jgi:hypothetical protein
MNTKKYSKKLSIGADETKTDSKKDPHVNAKSDTLEDEAYRISLAPNDAAQFFGLATDSFHFTNVSLYSTTPYYQSLYIAKLLTSFYDPLELQKLVLTDANANIGGNTWSFAKLVKQVNAIELSEVNYKCLVHNIAECKLDNVKFYLGNCLDFLTADGSLSLTQDILFFDPPWGGVNYKLENKPLGYSITKLVDSVGKSVTERHLLHDLIKGPLANAAQVIMMKLPAQYYDKHFDACRDSYPYLTSVEIRDDRDYPIYKITILSKIKNKRPIQTQKFRRVNYRGMRTTKLE